MPLYFHLHRQSLENRHHCTKEFFSFHDLITALKTKHRLLFNHSLTRVLIQQATSCVTNHDWRALLCVASRVKSILSIHTILYKIMKYSNYVLKCSLIEKYLDSLHYLCALDNILTQFFYKFNKERKNIWNTWRIFIEKFIENI